MYNIDGGEGKGGLDRLSVTGLTGTAFAVVDWRVPPLE